MTNRENSFSNERHKSKRTQAVVNSLRAFTGTKGENLDGGDESDEAELPSDNEDASECVNDSSSDSDFDLEKEKSDDDEDDYDDKSDCYSEEDSHPENSEIISPSGVVWHGISLHFNQDHEPLPLLNMRHFHYLWMRCYCDPCSAIPTIV
jgi:hypothetical protein